MLFVAKDLVVALRGLMGAGPLAVSCCRGGRLFCLNGPRLRPGRLCQSFERRPFWKGGRPCYVTTSSIARRILLS